MPGRAQVALGRRGRWRDGRRRGQRDSRARARRPQLLPADRGGAHTVSVRAHTPMCACLSAPGACAPLSDVCSSVRSVWRGVRPLAARHTCRGGVSVEVCSEL
eukprot:7378205-Prymnesium_polylepis.1